MNLLRMPRMLCRRRGHRAFTLIELLIVVAIIAVLASIAVPNFLEAQTRAKVSRCRADMRTMSIAIEAYRIDNNKYPLTAGLRRSTGQIEYPLATVPGTNYDNIWVGPALTTPLAYTTTLPTDLFFDNDPRAEMRFYYFRDFRWMREWYVSRGQTLPAGPEAHNRAFGEWFILGAGPDRDRLDISGSNEPVTRMYDPSNGTISDGDLAACQKTGVFK